MSMTSIVTLIGRILLALIFLLSALSKIGDYSGTVGYMQGKGIPAAQFFLFAAVIVELAGALLLITGYKARIGALLLAIYLVPVTYIFHYLPAFNAGLPTTEQRIQMVSMMKNLSIFGGLLLAFGNGVGKWTLGKE